MEKKCVVKKNFLLIQKKNTLYVQRNVAKKLGGGGVKGSNLGLCACPMNRPRAVQWYQFYAGTPSSLFVRRCLEFDFSFV